MEYSTKNLIFKQFFKRNLYRKMIASRVTNQITAFAIVY